MEIGSHKDVLADQKFGTIQILNKSDKSIVFLLVARMRQIRFLAGHLTCFDMCSSNKSDLLVSKIYYSLKWIILTFYKVIIYVILTIILI